MEPLHLFCFFLQVSILWWEGMAVEASDRREETSVGVDEVNSPVQMSRHMTVTWYYKSLNVNCNCFKVLSHCTYMPMGFIDTHWYHCFVSVPKSILFLAAEIHPWAPLPIQYLDVWLNLESCCKNLWKILPCTCKVTKQTFFSLYMLHGAEMDHSSSEHWLYTITYDIDETRQYILPTTTRL